MTPLVEMRDIVKRFPGVLANNHVHISVEPGEVHALLGENGAGKSTLMKILYGLYHQDQGQILIDGELQQIDSPKKAIAQGIGMIHQDFMLIPRFTVVENVVLGLEEEGSHGFLQLEEAGKRVKELSERHGLAVDPWAKIEHLPVGVQQRVEIVKLLYRSARVLILDEPTAVLTPQEVEGLFEVVRSLVSEGRAMIFITHKLHEVMEVADQVTVLRDGQTIATKKASDSNPRELARMMVGREVKSPTRKPKETREGEAKLSVNNLHVKDAAGNPQVRGVDLLVYFGEILGLAGVDGNGQNELAEAVMNLRPISSGQVIASGQDVTELSPAKHHQAGMAYVPADRRKVGSVGELSLAKNCILGNLRKFASASGFLLYEDRIQDHAHRLIENYDVRAPGPHFEAAKLSGGNLQKMVLGRELMREPAILIAEQPTRGLDVGAAEYVRRQLLAERDRGAAILLISAELEEILQLSDRIAVIYRGQVMGVIDADSAEIDDIGLMMAGTRIDEINGLEAACD